MKKLVKRVGAAIVVLSAVAFIAGCTALVSAGPGYKHCRRWCHNGWCSRHCWRN